MTAAANHSDAKRAERLVAEGLRHWLDGYATGDLQHWQRVWNLHVEALGPKRARDAVEKLARWVRTLQECSGCPLHNIGCSRDRCRDECLAVAAVAACQHRDDACLELCLGALSPGGSRTAGIGPALAYAEVMAEAGLRLDRVPIEIVARLAERPPQARLH